MIGGAESCVSGVRRARSSQPLPASPSIYLTGEAHHGFNKIAHMTGIGRRAVRTSQDRPRAEARRGDLARQVARTAEDGWAPFLVVGTAGTTAAGVIDPLPEIAQFCREESLWFHADAAWGGAAILSPRLRGASRRHRASRLDHLRRAQVAFRADGLRHVLLPSPRRPSREAFRARRDLHVRQATGPVFDPLTNSVQWSRRFIGLKLFLALANMGESGYAAMIEHQARLGDVLREALERRWLADRQRNAAAAGLLHA